MTWSPELVDLVFGDEVKKGDARFVTRLKELHVPRVDAVDKGANQKTFLIRKSETIMDKSIVGPEVTVDLGTEANPETKIDKTEPAETPEAMLSALADAQGKLNALVDLTKDESKTVTMDEVQKAADEVQTILKKMGKKPKKMEGDGEDGKGKPPFLKTKKSDDEPADSIVMKRLDDGSVDLGDGVVVPAGDDADMVWNTIQKAGRKMSSKRLAKLRKSMVDLITLWKELDPDDVHKQVQGLFADVKKRMDGLDGTNEEILKQLKALNARQEAGTGAPKPTSISDGQSGAGEPVKKSAPATSVPVIPAGVDFGDTRFHS